MKWSTTTSTFFYYWFLISGYGDLHAHIVYVDQFHRLSADDRLHWGELALGLILNTSPAVCYGFQEGLGHPWPPEVFLHQTERAVPALVSSAMVAPSIAACLSLVGTTKTGAESWLFVGVAWRYKRLS